MAEPFLGSIEEQEIDPAEEKMLFQDPTFSISFFSYFPYSNLLEDESNRSKQLGELFCINDWVPQMDGDSKWDQILGV